jgi:hypothetical protein
MANDQPQKKPGFFGQLLASMGLAKPEPQAAAPAKPTGTRSPTGPVKAKPGTGEQFTRTPQNEGSGQLKESKANTQPLSPEEKAKQSEERRYLISAYESTPTLIPEFQNPQYMYKMISNERDYTQEVLNGLLNERKQLLLEHGGDLPPHLEEHLQQLDIRAQELRNDLTRFFLLIKRVAGIQKSGTGGTDFLDPLRG